MKHIVAVTMASPHHNFDRTIKFLNQEIRLSLYGTNFNLDLLKKLVQKFDGHCDVISVSGLPHAIKYRGGTFIHPTTLEFKNLTKHTMVVDGSVLRDVYLPWTVRDFCQKNPQLIKKQKIGFYSGLLQRNLIDIFEEFSARLSMADPYFFLKLPFTVEDSLRLDQFFKYMRPFLSKLPLNQPYRRNFNFEHKKFSGPLQKFTDCHVFVTTAMILGLIDLEHLQNKTVVLDYLSPHMEKKLKKVGVNNVVTCMPQIIDEPNINFAILEGVFQLFKKEELPLTNDDILMWIEKLKLRPQIRTLNQQRPNKKIRFSFVIHPLHQKDLFKHPLLRPARKLGKSMALLEKAVNLSPPFHYGEITGIKSLSTGQEVEGLIYAVMGTPKMLLASDPHTVYKKLIQVGEESSRLGADIMGLGAYTKIVGDAGVSVAQGSPIPVTTGNSLSAAATLWAAKLAVSKMGFVPIREKIYQGRAMVIGASGSIGSVAAKLLAQRWKELILVAPRGHKLLELKDAIAEIAPETKIHICTDPSLWAGKCDLIITTTSNFEERVLNIEQVKSGCVICDVSRPFDISEEDALTRPDVLVIASGEVELPGKVNVGCDLGLEGNTVYACLAETALLALEGRFESFTLSRNISYQKVREIDEMARRHGVKLSAIMGHSGVITDQEIALCREHALKEKARKVKKKEKAEDKF